MQEQANPSGIPQGFTIGSKQLSGQVAPSQESLTAVANDIVAQLIRCHEYIAVLHGGQEEAKAPVPATQPLTSALFQIRTATVDISEALRGLVDRIGRLE